MKKRVYVIDDDPGSVKAATFLLESEGYAVKSFTSPVQGLMTVKDDPPDLVLLDLNMPEMDGYAVCRAIKADPKTNFVPVIMVSVKSEEVDVVVGLEMGATDYVYKPFRKRELAARIRTALSRSAPTAYHQFVEVGPFRLDYGTYLATVNGKPLEIRPKEFELLGFLIQREGHIITRQAIAENVWGVALGRTMSTIDFHMHQLRKKLGPYGVFIKGLKGVGYRFEISD